MKNVDFIQTVVHFLKNNWFKLSITGLMLLAWFRKDLSLQVRMDGPSYQYEKNTAKPKEKMTDAAPLATGLSPNTGRMEAPAIGLPSFSSGAGKLELSKIDEAAQHAYLTRFAKVAKEEQKKYGIPASIILAVSLYQSGAGQRDIAQDVNNYFAMPCNSDWNGACREFQGQVYRKYSSAWASFRDFSLFAKENFKRLKGADYQAWALALEADGFAETDNFAKEITDLIVAFRLDAIDE
ncbi:MAG: glucosaminidase domain-containing protein [Saprospiraceae bacterium]|jgi:flagellum-specific peptidoglycan hydrolase FlgJ|nr:glucosaminidase domain-containing protein [Saprospiraceae bacterium]